MKVRFKLLNRANGRENLQQWERTLSKDGMDSWFRDGRYRVTLPTIMVGVMGIVHAMDRLINHFEFAWRISNASHAAFASLLFALFLTYVVMDIIRYSHQGNVLLAGIAALLVAGYWWIGFMARHEIPAEPILPSWLYPGNGVYLLLACYLGFWACWDMQSAYKHSEEEGLEEANIGIIYQRPDKSLDDGEGSGTLFCAWAVRG